jgi:hypothetical protein
MGSAPVERIMGECDVAACCSIIVGGRRSGEDADGAAPMATVGGPGKGGIKSRGGRTGGGRAGEDGDAREGDKGGEA